MLFRYNSLEELTEVLKQYDFFKNKNFNLKPLKSDNMCRTFLMTDNIGTMQYVVRINNISSPKSVEKEVKTINFLNNQGNYDWIPKLYFYDENYNVSVTEYYPNCSTLENLDTNDNSIETKNISNQIYKIINELHSIKSDQPIDVYNDLYAELQNQIDWAIDFNIINEEEGRTICQFYEGIDGFKNVKPTFIHADISPDNLIYNKDLGKMFLIDFEFSRFSDKNYDYAHMMKKVDKKFLGGFEKQFQMFKNTDTYFLYDLYFRLCWYQPNIIEGNDEQLAQIKEIISQMKAFNDYKNETADLGHRSL